MSLIERCFTEADDDVFRRLEKFDERRLGDFGEAVWSKIFAASGIHYVSLAKIFEGGAPMARGGDGAIILPDFEVAGDGWGAYLDSKAKTQVVLYRKEKQRRHGINATNWQHYKRISERFQRTCGIGIVELFHEDGTTWSGSILIQTLRQLGTPFYGESTQSHMVYWRQKDFVNLDSLSPAELFGIANGKRQRSYAEDLERVFNRKKQGELFGED